MEPGNEASGQNLRVEPKGWFLRSEAQLGGARERAFWSSWSEILRMILGLMMKVRIFILAPHRGHPEDLGQLNPDGPLSSSRKEKEGGKTSAWITTGYLLSGGSEGLKSVTLLVGRAHEVAEGRSRRPIRAEPPAIFPWNGVQPALRKTAAEDRQGEILGEEGSSSPTGRRLFFATCRRFRPTRTGSPVALYRVALYSIVETAI